MKILAFSHTGLVTGGAEQCLLEYVAVLTSRGHQCRVIMPHEGPMQKVFSEKGIENKIIGYGWAIRPFRKVDRATLQASTGNSLTKIFKEVKEYKPDLILVNTSVIPWGLYAGRTLGVPSVLLVHEILNDKDPSLDVLPNYKEYVAVLDLMADTVVYNSEFVRDEFKHDIVHPMISKKILYPLPPLDSEKVKALLRENRIDDTLKIAIFGALAPRKNQLEAVETANLLKKKGITNFEIDFYGDAAANLSYVRQIKEKIAHHKLEKHVQIKGFSHSVYEAMNDYNVVLSTSTYEPFGRTIVEGQLFGRVTIANNTGGGPELIKDEHTGLVYELGKPEDLARKIEWILRNPAKALELGATAKTVQTKKFLNDSRYDALIETVEYYDGKGDAYQAKAADDLFNPIRSLYEYTNQLHMRYGKIERIVNNRATRKLKGLVAKAKTKAKRIVKEILVK